ncbi:MAG: hypothetical protein ACE5ES_04025 [Candidatus Nanoarchaeia archaeon]
MPNKRGQGAIEFVTLFGFLMFFFVVFFGIIQNNMNDRNFEKREVIAQNIALGVQEELSLAAEASEGYSRDFEVPLNLLGKDYNIEIIDNSIFISTDNIGISYKIIVVQGQIQKGTNTIRKNGGVVYLN